ncbi:MAG: hypothetical protein OEY51_07925 [Cyclobacteriaceae bacterium]|nr:hypothetical protein [Cyclobacteriaceae bacterium]
MINDTSELRRQLLEASVEYKDEIREGLQGVVSKLGKTGVNALVIGGALVTSFLLYRALSGGSRSVESKGNKNKEERNEEVVMPSFVDKLADKVLEQMLLFLLALAKEKLLEYLNDQKNDNDDSTVTS